MEANGVHVELEHASAPVLIHEEPASEPATRVPGAARRGFASLEYQPRMPVVVSMRISSVSNAVLVEDPTLLGHGSEGDEDSSSESSVGANTVAGMAKGMRSAITGRTNVQEDSESDRGDRLVPLHSLSGAVRSQWCAVRVSLQNSVVETRAFPAPHMSLAPTGESVAQVGEVMRLPGRILPEPRSPANMLSVELIAFDDYSPDAREVETNRGFVVGAVHLHLHDLARARRVTNAEFDFFSGDATVGRIKMSLTFCYGAFGFGHGTILQQGKRSVTRSVQHSLYPRIRPPAGRLDPVRMTMAPTVQRMPSLLYTRPTLLGLHRELARLRSEELADAAERERGAESVRRTHAIGDQLRAAGACDYHRKKASSDDSSTSTSSSTTDSSPEVSAEASAAGEASVGLKPVVTAALPPDASDTLSEGLSGASARARATACLGYGDDDDFSSEGDGANSDLNFGDVTLPDEELARLFVRDMHAEYPLTALRLDAGLRDGRAQLDEIRDTGDRIPTVPHMSARRSRLGFLWKRVHSVTSCPGPTTHASVVGAGTGYTAPESAIGWQSYLKHGN